MSYAPTFIEPSNTEMLDLEIVNDKLIEEQSDDIIAGYGRCTVRGCTCRVFTPITSIPGAMLTCATCMHGMYEHVNG